MFSKLLKRRVAIRAPVSPAVPDETIVWAIGDIHGRLDLLEPMVEAILADAQDHAGQRTVAVFLGDYIDRGPCSREVIQLLAHLRQDEGVEWRFLKGNHEKAMLGFLGDRSEGAKWCDYGGDATLKSYGLRVPQLKHKLEGWDHLSADLNHKLTPAERGFLETLELSVSIGDYFFAHAGARPGESLERQAEEDLIWIRRSFLDSDVEFEKVIVHGHTPSSDVHLDHRRIGIDTKAYESGVLTALRLSGTEQTFVQVVIEGAETLLRITSKGVTSVRQIETPVATPGLRSV
jgi:serine/threonine protein phosphatase 1